MGTGRTRRRFAGLALAIVALLAGCGGGQDLTKARVRLVNATGGDSALGLTVGADTVATSVPYGASASYQDVDPKGSVANLTAPGSAAVLVSSTVAVTKKNYYSMLAYGKAGALTTLLLDDNSSTPSSGQTLVRVINTAPDAGALDVYLTGAGDALSLATALQGSVGYGSLGGYNTVNSGTWRLRVTAAGSKTDLRLDVSGLGFGSEGVVTLVLTPGKGGVLVNALLLAQQGGITNAANTQARVRVVAGVSGGASVVATVGGSALLGGVGAPTLTAYALVGAGVAVPVAVSADGTAAALNAVTLAGGGDYTLLVYGAPAQPLATLLADDNTLPDVATSAKLRLVHGLADVGGTLALKLNYLAVVDSVAQGGASAYVDVNPSITAQLIVTAAGVATPLITTGSNQTLLANSGYSYFVVGTQAAPVGILSQDR